MLKYRLMRPEELKEVAHLITNAFWDYPIFTLPFGKQKDYGKLLYTIQKVNLRAHLNKWSICIVGENEQQKIVCAAILQNTQRPDITFSDLVHAGGLKLLKYTSLIKLLKFLNALDSYSKLCKGYGVWYLDTLAVSPEYKGMGYGSSILQDAIKPFVKRRKGRIITLITNTELNCKFYKKNGFTEFAKGHAVLSKNSAIKTTNTWCFKVRLA